MSTFRFRVTGRVQGVGFRAFVVLCAKTHGVAGEVWNSRDGSVEGICESEDCAAFLAALKKGPGHIEEVTYSEIERMNCVSFQIRQTH